MIKLKNIGLAGLVLAAVGMSPTVMAQPTLTGTIALYQNTSEYSYAVGGEFTAIATGTSGNLLGAYDAGVTTQTVGAGTGFQTFCVQTGVDMSPGTSYSYTTSLGSIGLAGSDSHANAGLGTADVYNLSVGAAWLYSQFAQGKLTGYNYAVSGGNNALTSLPTAAAGTGATRLFDAGELQAAIWYLQGEQTYSSGAAAYTLPTGSGGNTNNIFYAEALAHFGGTFAAADVSVTAATYSTYGVEILNLYTGTSAAAGTDFQNQLVYLGCPDGGASLALLGLGLTGLAVFGRKLKVGRRTM